MKEYQQIFTQLTTLQLFTPPLPDKDIADTCLRCHNQTLWPEPRRALNNLSKNPTAFQDADGYICPLCGQEEDIRHLRQVIKDMTLQEGR